MQQDNSSFWTDIKVLEEQLAANPDSFCFAKLSEVYIKVGLLDDALHTVRKGVAKHPRYLAGQRALAMVCHAKGLSAESMDALKLVTEAVPEDLECLKLLGRVSIELGEPETAANAYRTALEFEPDDVECRLELESLIRSEAPDEAASSVCEEDEEEILEDLEIIEDIEIYEDDDEQQEYEFGELESLKSVPSEPPSDPLSTGTLAELYVSQGFIHKALEIYRNLSADNPADGTLSARIAELESLESADAVVSEDEDEDYAEDNTVDFEQQQQFAGFDQDEPKAELTATEQYLPAAGVAAVASVASLAMADPVTETVAVVADNAGPFDKNDLLGNVGSDAVNIPPSTGTADNAVSILEGWLENIRRIRL